MTNLPEDARFQVFKETARKWHVIDNANGGEQVDGPFKTRHLAEAAAVSLNADNEPVVEDEAPQVDEAAVASLAERIQAAVEQSEATGEAVQVTTLDVAEAEAIDPASMTRTDRYLAAKAEVEAVRQWKLNGNCAGPVPATPVLDWMADPANAAAKAKPAGERKTTAHTPEQTETITHHITYGRTQGLSWAKIAANIDAEGIPTARGGKWYDTTVSDLAKKLGLADIKPAPEEVSEAS